MRAKSCCIKSCRIKSRKAFVKSALDDAIVACQQADRPVRAEDQAILAETFCGVRDHWKQTVRVPIVPDRLGGEAGNLAPDIAAAAKHRQPVRPLLAKTLGDRRLGGVIEDKPAFWKRLRGCD